MNRLTDKNWKNPENLMWIKLGSIHMRDEGYRTFLSEALRKLAYYEDLEDEPIKALTYDRNQYEKEFSDAIPKWISVEERLPKAEENVLVTIKDDSADSPIYYTSVGWYYKGIWVVENEVSHQVTAWMPRPKPYKD